MSNPLRNLPSVHEVLALPRLHELTKAHAHERIVAAVRGELDELRVALKDGREVDGQAHVEAIAARVEGRLERETRPVLRRVINATGIVLHTNLGRAPLAEEAAQAAYEAGRGYLNLELDLETGKRSSRQQNLRSLACRITGAESATFVNNNAAATVLVLRALCRGREVVLSRGQLIEIGGSFRIPDILAVSGATLREVGTTNITRLSDYEQALGIDTAALMQIHTSNYRVSGFTKSVPLADLVALGKKHGVLVIDDIGSGAMVDFAPLGFSGEPVARDSLAAGADLVLCSGDKLLGGPQAGIILGSAALIARIEKDPLMRAFRLDKMTLAALEASLRLYLNPEQALAKVPVLRLLSTPLEELRARAEDLAQRLQGKVATTVRQDVAYVGGGSLPDQSLPTWIVEVDPGPGQDAEMARRLRTGSPAVMPRVQEGKIVLDVRTVFPEQLEEVARALLAALGMG